MPDDEDDRVPEIPQAGNLGPPFDSPAVARKLRALSSEVAKYRQRRTAAERDAAESRAIADRERQRREAVEAAFFELTKKIQGLEVLPR